MASSDSSLSSARTGEPLPLLPQVPSSSVSSVLHDKLTSIMVRHAEIDAFFSALMCNEIYE